MAKLSAPSGWQVCLRRANTYPNLMNDSAVIHDGVFSSDESALWLTHAHPRANTDEYLYWRGSNSE